MSEDRARIFARIAAARAARPGAEPYPDWDDALAVAGGRLAGADPVESFRANFEAAAGRCYDSVDALADALLGLGARVGYVDPALTANVGAGLGRRFELHARIERAAIDRLDFAVTRASGAVAETGSLVLTDHDTADRLAAVGTWIHVAVLDPRDVVPDVRAGLALAPMDPYAVFVTGPSQTADVEGILIRGVHGPGEQLCLMMPGTGGDGGGAP